MNKKLLLTVFSALFLVTSAFSSLLVEIPLNERMDKANLVVEGKVISQHSYWDEDRNMIYTSNVIEVYKIFKGTLMSGQIQIITEGGIVGTDKIVVDPVLELQIGEMGMFTCINTDFEAPSDFAIGLQKFDTYASVQGFIKYSLKDASATDPFSVYKSIKEDLYPKALLHNATYLVVKKFDVESEKNRIKAHSTPPPSISSFTPTTSTAGTGSVITINGSNFGATQGTGVVGFKNADDGGVSYINPLATQYTSWSDTQILVEIPENAGTGTIRVVTDGGTATSASSLTISYAQINANFDKNGVRAYQTNHIDDDGNGGYTFTYNTTFNTNSDAVDAFERAINTWRCYSGINFAISESTSAVTVAANDGINLVLWDDNEQLPSGVLGRCTSRFSGCHGAGNDMYWYVNELDIKFDSGRSWHYETTNCVPGKFDFESVAAHEVGHGHQMAHVIDGPAMMHYSIGSGATKRVLSANDQNGADDVVSRSTSETPCGKSSMTTYSCVASTRLHNDYNGATNLTMGAQIKCDYVDNADAFEWLFEHTGSSYSQTFLREANNRIVQLEWVEGLGYGKTYDVSVRARVSGNWGDYGDVRQISTASTASIPSPSVDGACPKTNVALDDLLQCSFVYGAEDYEWIFVQNGETLSFVRGYGNRFVNLNWIPGMAFNKTYAVQVRARIGDDWGSYGATCNVSTLATIPSPRVEAGYCGQTNAGRYAVLKASYVSNPEDFGYIFINGTDTVFYNRGYGNRWVELAWVPGLEASTTYTVKVRVQVGGTWGAYGVGCSLNTGASFMTIYNLDNYLNQARPLADAFLEPGDGGGGTKEDVVASIEDDPEVHQRLGIYPNPSDGRNIIISMENIENGTLRVVDIYGKTIHSEQLNSDQVNLNLSPDIAEGIYTVSIITDAEHFTKKLVIRK